MNMLEITWPPQTVGNEKINVSLLTIQSQYFNQFEIITARTALVAIFLLNKLLWHPLNNC